MADTIMFCDHSEGLPACLCHHSASSLTPLSSPIALWLWPPRDLRDLAHSDAPLNRDTLEQSHYFPLPRLPQANFFYPSAALFKYYFTALKYKLSISLNASRISSLKAHSLASSRNGLCHSSGGGSN